MVFDKSEYEYFEQSLSESLMLILWTAVITAIVIGGVMAVAL